MKVLLLEDNSDLVELIQEYLDKKNYQIDSFSNGEEALNFVFNGYDCFVLDINVPGKNGLSILKEIRSFDTKTPAIIISSDIQFEIIKKAYNTGCNDYIKKPFYIYELEKKLELLCSCISKIKIKGDYIFDMKLEQLYSDSEKEIRLTKKEVLLMKLLSKNITNFVSLLEIEHYVWEGYITNNENIRTLIKRIRKKLPKGAITTCSGRGYKLC